MKNAAENGLTGIEAERMEQYLKHFVHPLNDDGSPICRHCNSKYTTCDDMEWNGENEDGSIAPQIWTWECLDCGRYTQTLEHTK